MSDTSPVDGPADLLAGEGAAAAQLADKGVSDQDATEPKIPEKPQPEKPQTELKPEASDGVVPGAGDTDPRGLRPVEQVAAARARRDAVDTLASGMPAIKDEPPVPSVPSVPPTPPAPPSAAGFGGYVGPPAPPPASAGSGAKIRAALGAGLGLFLGSFVGLIFVFKADGFGGVVLGLIIVLIGTCGGAAMGVSGGSPATAAPPPPFDESAGARAGGAHPVVVPATVYVPGSLFPRPDLPETPVWVLPVAATVGGVAAIALPYAATGLGLVLTAVAMGAAVWPAVIRGRRGQHTLWTPVLWLLAYALVCVALFRDAEWVVGLAVLGAFGVGALAVSGGGKGWMGVIRGGLSVLIALYPVPWFLSKPVKRVLKRRRLMPVVISVVVTGLLLAVFGVLFASADAVFSQFLDDLLRAPEWVSSLPLRIFLFVVFGALVAAGVLVALRPVAEPAGPDLRRPVGTALWTLPLVGLNLLFALFVMVQITVLFGGNERVLKTAGLTYAEYARSGFFELVTVSVFVLGIVAAAIGLIELRGRTEQRIMAVLLGLLCVFTLIILGSAMHRMSVYIAAYGLSQLRAVVEAMIWWLGAVFVLVLIAGAVRLAGWGTGWLPRSLVLLTGVTLLAFAVWNPEARVAESHIAARQQGGFKIDDSYLRDLSADAVPYLDRLPEPTRTCVLRDVIEWRDLTTPDPWNGWNISRDQARALLAKHPISASVSCSKSAMP